MANFRHYGYHYQQHQFIYLIINAQLLVLAFSLVFINSSCTYTHGFCSVLNWESSTVDSDNIYTCFFSGFIWSTTFKLRLGYSHSEGWDIWHPGSVHVQFATTSFSLDFADVAFCYWASSVCTLDIVVKDLHSEKL